MKTEEMIVRILENPDVADVTANAIAAKLRAAEELAKQAETFVELACCDGDEEVLEALDNYRKAGGGE